MSIYPAILDRYFSISPFLTKQECNLLFQLSKQLSQGAIVVEIGSYIGGSTSCLAVGLAETKNVGKVYAVDTWLNDAVSEKQRDTYTEFLENTRSLHQWITPLRGFSKDIAEQFDDSIDLLFVDGDHSYEGVSTDLEAWLPKVKDGGIVVFHDYNWSEDIKQAIREFIVPLQIEGGHYCDSIYWTRISQQQNSQNSPYVVVAIPTYQRREYVLDSLKGVIHQETDLSYEVLVLDNACEPELQKQVEEIAANSKTKIRYIPVPEIGLHQARNAAALNSSAEIIAYIDDDTIVPPDWLSALCIPFQDEVVAGVAGRSIPKWERDRPTWLDQVHPSYFSLLDLGDESREMQFPESPYGCNMAFRRRRILELGGFAPDGMGRSGIEWYRGDGETGFAYKVYDRKDKIIYTGDAWLYHRIPAQRLSIDFLRSRTIKGAISSFYTQIRRHGFSRPTLALMAVKNFCKWAVLSIISLILRFQPNQRWLDLDLKAIQSRITALYQVRLIFDSKLRKWVFRQDYWHQEWS
jgi:glucosyl-dolichyl phosphate glucuronosyltransferase